MDKTVMATSDPFDDIFDGDVDEHVIQQKEWKKMKSQILKEGFRNGVSEGEELSLQEGFNFGYTQIIKLSYNLGKLRGKINAVLTMSQLGDLVFTPRETTASAGGSRETTDPVVISRETICKELERILQEITNFENELKKAVSTKCAEIATVESGTSVDVSVCSCDRLDHCPVCYGDSREMITDLGLDDLNINPVTDSQNSHVVSTESSTKLCIEQIAISYCHLLDEAKSRLDRYEKRVALILKENVEFH